MKLPDPVRVMIVGQLALLEVCNPDGSPIGSGEKGSGGSRGATTEGFTRRALRTAGQFAGGAGVAAAGAARNEAMPAFQASVAGATTALAALGPKGLVAGAGLQAVAQGVTAFKSTVDAFVARGRELGGLNAQLAGASAFADIRRRRDDIREANELGPQMARLIEQQAKAESTFRELLLPIKEWMLGGLNTILQTSLETIVELLQATREGLAKLDAVFGGLGPPVARIDAMLRRIREIMEGRVDVDMLSEWRLHLALFRGPPGRPDAAPGGPAPPRVGAPFPVPR